MATSKEICQLLGLQPHPEGGFFAESFKDSHVTLPHTVLPPTFKVGRSVSTAIYFLVPTGNVSCLHRIPSSEVWHFYKGDPLTVFEIDDEGKVKHTVLGQDIATGQKLMYVQRPNVWFGAYPTKDIERIWEGGKAMVKAAPRDPETHFSLVGCTVAPGFEFDDFELASRSDMLAKFPHAEDFVEFLTHDP